MNPQKGPLLPLLAALLLLCGHSEASEPLTVVTKNGQTATLGQVLNLDENTFADHVAGQVNVFVKFYAPWCGHCKKMAPVWRDLANEILKEPSLKFKTIIADVNADEEKDLAAEYNVKGYPTFVHFPPSNTSQTPVHYTSGQTIPEFINFLKQRTVSQLSATKTASRVFALDILAWKFRQAEGDAEVQQDMMKRIKEVHDRQSTPESMKLSAGIYLKLMDKAIKAEDMAKFFDDEKSRLERLMHSGSLSDEKIRDMSARRSIIDGFLKEPLLPGGVQL